MKHGEQHIDSGGLRRILDTRWTYAKGIESISLAYDNAIVELDGETKKAIAEADASPVYIKSIDALFFGNSLLISKGGLIKLPDGIELVPQDGIPKEIKGAVFAATVDNQRNFISIREKDGEYQWGYLFSRWGNSARVEAIGTGAKLILLEKGNIISELSLPDLTRNDNPSCETVYFTDPRDNKRYSTVPIGNQTWLAENLCWEGAGVWYDNNKANGKKYGRLYTWDEALKVAPTGWHLPTDEEWRELIKHVGGSSKAAVSLKAEDWDGNDAFGFSALPGGYRVRDSDVFLSMGTLGFWWSATKHKGDKASSLQMSSGIGKSSRQKPYKNNAFNARLVQN
jgi:uncharacterized protein (TIGR02145 family)